MQLLPHFLQLKTSRAPTATALLGAAQAARPRMQQPCHLGRATLALDAGTAADATHTGLLSHKAE